MNFSNRLKSSRIVSNRLESSRIVSKRLKLSRIVSNHLKWSRLSEERLEPAKMRKQFAKHHHPNWVHILAMVCTKLFGRYPDCVEELRALNWASRIKSMLAQACNFMCLLLAWFSCKSTLLCNLTKWENCAGAEKQKHSHLCMKLANVMY